MHLFEKCLMSDVTNLKHALILNIKVLENDSESEPPVCKSRNIQELVLTINKIVNCSNNEHEYT